MFKRNFTKIFLAAIIGLALIAPAASQDIDKVKDGIIWTNSEKDFSEVNAECSSGEQGDKIDKVVLELDEEVEQIYTEAEKQITLNKSDFTDKIENIDEISEEKSLSLYCQDDPESSVGSTTVEFAQLNEEGFSGVDDSAVGFVGELMKDETGSLGNKEGLKMNYDFSGNVQDVYDLSAGWDISIGPGMTFEKESASIKAKDGELLLYPFVSNYPEGLESSVNITREGEFSKEYQIDDNDFFVHEWKAEKVGDSNPGRDMTYEQVSEGEYEFYLNMTFRDRENLPATDLLESEDFRLTVKERGDNGDYDDFPNEDDSYEEMKVMKQEDPGSNSKANYQVYVEEYSKLDVLNSGRYKFILEVVYDTEEDANSPEKFKVDETRVDKTSEFSGVVLNSGGSGVVSEMVLKDEKQGTKQNLVTDNTGRYSTEIKSSSNDFDVDARFYKRTGDTGTIHDGEISLSGAKLEDSDLGPGGSAIKFDYLQNPDVNIEGLNPVNMMMVKFGYPLDNIEDINMAFDSGKVDPQSMKVFECDAWNFEGEDCLTSWSSISEDDTTVNPATWTVSLDDTDLYEIEGEKILMNAYVIGSNSRIELQDAIDVPDLSIQSGETLEASGVLIDENGNRVEDANVTLSLIGGDGEWTASSDSTGSFEFQEDLEDVEKGNYQLRLEASKPPYEPLEKKSSSTVEVYYEKSINVDSQSEPLIPPGERYDIDYEVENNGQTAVKDIEFDISGVNRNRYELSHSELELLEPGEIDTVTLTLDPPEEFETPPSIEFGALGTVEGEEVKGSTTTLVSFDDSVEKSENSTSDQENQTESNTETEDSNVSEEITRATGDFIQSQSDMNLALGLILVFGMILAVAVRKRKNDGGRDDRMNGRMGSRPVSSGGRVQKPDVSSKKVESRDDSEDEEESSSSKDSDEDLEESHSGDNVESDQEDEDDAEGFVCDKCGESFDTESGLKLHAQALH